MNWITKTDWHSTIYPNIVYAVMESASDNHHCCLYSRGGNNYDSQQFALGFLCEKDGKVEVTGKHDDIFRGTCEQAKLLAARHHHQQHWKLDLAAARMQWTSNTIWKAIGEKGHYWVGANERLEQLHYVCTYHAINTSDNGYDNGYFCETNGMVYLQAFGKSIFDYQPNGLFVSPEKARAVGEEYERQINARSLIKELEAL